MTVPTATVALLCALHVAQALFVSSRTSLGRNNRIRCPSFAIDKFANALDGTEFDVGACDIPGTDWQRPSKVNQDRYFVHEGSSSAADDVEDDDDDGREYSLIGVLDGHGRHGEQVSSFAAKNLPRAIADRLASVEELPERVVEFERRAIRSSAGFDCDGYKSTCSRTQRALVDAFHVVHCDAVHDEGIRAGRNGSTCVVCHVDRRTLECNVAYVGDSRAIHISGSDGSISVVAEELTVDLPDERRRIELGEGSIRGRNVFYGPVGIAMTRALGDAVMARAGVIPTPAVGHLRLDRGDALVLATDGVWDVVKNERVRDIASSRAGAQDAAEDIAKAARERWVGDLPIVDEVKADDIAVVVLKC